MTQLAQEFIEALFENEESQNFHVTEDELDMFGIGQEEIYA